MSKSKGKNKVLSKKEKHDSLDKIDRTMEDLMGLHREKKTIPKLAIEAKKIIKHKIRRSESEPENTLLQNCSSVIKENPLKTLDFRKLKVCKTDKKESRIMGKVVKEGKELFKNVVAKPVLFFGKTLGELYKGNLENKDKLMAEDIKKWKNAKTLEEKERHLKNASGKVFTGFKSVYLGLYIANNEVRNFYLERNEKAEKHKDAVLYLEKFPEEYKRIMNLTAVKAGISERLRKIGEEMEIKAKKMKEGESIPIRYEELNYPINLEAAGGFEWGNTKIRFKDIKGTLEKKNGEYIVNLDFTPYLQDGFDDVVDLANADNKDTELKNGIPFDMMTKGTPKNVKFKVKNISEISEKMRRGYSNVVRNKNGGTR